MLTYHHGPKVVGVAFGSISSRVLAAEVIDCSDDRGRFRESVYRIVEFGLAYQPGAFQQFLSDLGVPSCCRVTVWTSLVWMSDTDWIGRSVSGGVFGDEASPEQ